MNTPSSCSGRTVPAPMQMPAEQDHERLLDPSGAQVEEVEEVRRQQQQGEVGEVAGPLAAEAGDGECGEAECPGGLDRTGREPPRQHRPGMAAPAARRIAGVAAPEHVVEEAEQGDPQQVGGPAVEAGLEEVEVGAIVEDRQRRQRDHRDRDHQRAARERDRPPAPVLPGQAAPQHVRRPGRQQPDRQQPRDDEAGDRHGASAPRLKSGR